MSYPIVQRLLETPHSSDSKGDTDQLLEYIKTHCQPWLREVKDQTDPMWRCVKSDVKDWSVIAPRQDRKPRDSSAEAQDLFNTVLSIAHMPNNRSNSVFVSGGLRSGATDASVYGPNCGVIIPVGEFTYAWSPQIYDMYSQLKNAAKANTFLRAVNNNVYESGRRAVVRLADELSIKTTFRDVFAKYASGINGDFDFKDDKGDSLNIPDPMAKQIYQWVNSLDERGWFAYRNWNESIAAWVGFAEQDPIVRACVMPMINEIASTYKDTDLSEAITSTHEIMLGCKQYLMIGERVWYGWSDHEDRLQSKVERLISDTN